MSDTTSDQRFGVRAAALTTSDALLELEQSDDKTDLFAEVDELLGEILVRSLNGREVLRIGDNKSPLSVPDLTPKHQQAIDEHYAISSQHRKGAWYLPEKVTIKAGLQNLAWYFATFPRFATGIAYNTRVRLSPAESPTAVFAWVATEPLFERLFIPFDLRGGAAGTKSQEDQIASWADYDQLVADLGLDLREPLAVMRYGSGWGLLHADAQLEAKKGLLAALAAQASPQLGAHYRAHRLLLLIDHYYAKAKGGVARRKQVVTRAFQRDLSAFFGGDWLALVRYLGEQPHPDEHIQTALPEVNLMVAGTKRAATVAEPLSLPAVEVQQVEVSPVEERVAILKDFWLCFDHIHSGQAPGMPTLHRLVDDYQDWHLSASYRHRVPADLRRRINAAWGTTMLPRWPEHIVSSLAPHASMAAAFGPALTFWQGVGETAWAISEGPYSNMDVGGLAERYATQLDALVDLGCPVDARLFDELATAESRLGPPQKMTRDVSRHETPSGIVVTMSTDVGTRRAGFEGLRDVTTRCRQAWAEHFLDSYLRARWDGEIREAARLYLQAKADRQKPPTPKQFAPHCVESVNHWFGGDLSAFYDAIGEKFPLEPIRVSLMPADLEAFVQTVFERLGGQPISDTPVTDSDYSSRVQDHDKFYGLANHSLRVIQLEEALSRAPKVTEFGRQAFEYRSQVLADDPAVAWERYIEVIEACLVGSASTVDSANPTAADARLAEPDTTSSAPPPPPTTPPGVPAPAPAPPPPAAARRWRRWLTRGQ
jgi:hypothetical protein